MDLQNLIKQFRWYFDIRGIETDELPNAPTGWRDMLIEFSKSSKYGGLFRQITGQLDFVGRAAYLLRREYAAYRLMAWVNLRINQDTRQPYNTYANIYTGKIDFSKKIDKQEAYTVNAKSLDFSQNIDAYDSTPYAIPLTGGINVEIPGLNLNETATLVPSGPPDGNVHADYFIPLQLVNNTQNSIDQSSYDVQYAQIRDPDFATQQSFFYECRLTGKLLLTGGITYRIDSNSDFPTVQTLGIFNQSGTLVFSIFTGEVTEGSNNAYTFNNAINVTKGDKLFLYTSINVEESDAGIHIATGQINLAYQTTTPPTMCQALTGSQLFAALLQAMNINTDNAPNAAVYCQSYLLANALAPLVFTCSDSIRAAQGSIYIAGNTLSPGVYKVIGGSVSYNETEYTLNQQFTFNPAETMFAGTGIVQKIQSIFVGSVYNPGDDLQAGGIYQVGGDNTGEIVYNTRTYVIGETFTYVLGQATFTASDDTMFVQQVGINPQIQISFSDFFQAVKATNSGDCAFGVNQYTALNNTPSEQAKQLAGIPFIENMAAIYKTGAMPTPKVNLGTLSKDWQSTTALDMMYNTISVGQKDQQYDTINGYQEVSSTQYYSSSLLTPVADLNLVSTVRYDPYGIEILRVSMNDTAASRSDNDTFGFWLNTAPITVGTPAYTYFKPLGSEGLSQPIVGVDPSYYNYKLSPKSNLLRSPGYLASIFYGMTGYSLTLTDAKKNTAMVYVGVDGVRIAEADPVEISDLGPAYFIPEYYTDTIECPDISANPYSDLLFNVNGNTYSAFPVTYKSNPAMSKPQEVKLLLSASVINNLSNTVR
jgi:hypothetical protein